ncbi:Putative transcriptional regulator (fragment) [Cupriavidus taiwanensis]|uniref:Transcriptional regulator n=1 Tax=Cupriavidus taiwanensis TaxID=164546 RepID=A0A375JBT9_9BURK
MRTGPCAGQHGGGGIARLLRSPSPAEEPQDLAAHRCINLRTQPQVDAALAGLGIALLPEDELMPHSEAGRLVRVLEDWCPKFNGYHLYYPSRPQQWPAFALVVQRLRG